MCKSSTTITLVHDMLDGSETDLEVCDAICSSILQQLLQLFNLLIVLGDYQFANPFVWQSLLPAVLIQLVLALDA